MALFAFGLATQSADRSLDTAVAAGQRPSAPAIAQTLPVLGAAWSSSLASVRGRIVVLNFWASWCTPCAAEAPLLERTERTLLRGGGTVLGVTFRDTAPDALAFVRSHRITYPSLRDVDGRLAAAYGTNELPETFVLDRQLRVVALSRGEVDSAFLKSALSRAKHS